MPVEWTEIVVPVLVVGWLFHYSTGDHQYNFTEEVIPDHRHVFVSETLNEKCFYFILEDVNVTRIFPRVIAH
jgi:hypothetical protein